jgi:hypothetical protein
LSFLSLKGYQVEANAAIELRLNKWNKKTLF